MKIGGLLSYQFIHAGYLCVPAYLPSCVYAIRICSVAQRNLLLSCLSPTPFAE